MYTLQSDNYSQKNKNGKMEIGYKKLTMGFQNYKDIKQAYLKNRTCQQSSEYKQQRQCTFQPQLSAKKSVHAPQKSRSLKQFLQDQEKFSTSKKMKIQQLRQQISKQEQDQLKGKPSINHSSHHLAARMSLKTNQQVFQRLSKQRKIIHDVFQLEEMFSPKICTKSKSLKRQKDVSNLLYQDAQRRQYKQRLRFQYREFVPQINSNTNNLVIRKIYSQFIDMVKQQRISPLLAITVLSQIFNVDLNPNKSRQQQQLCQKILFYIADTGTWTVNAQVLWDLIQTIVNGHLVKSSFTEQQQYAILQLFGYFYSNRLTRTKRSVSPERCSFKPKTLRSSQKLAQNHRQKTLSTINQYLTNEKSNPEPTKNTMKIQDVLIIQHKRKKAQNQRKKVQRQNTQIQQCSFRPNLQLSLYSDVQGRKASSRKVSLVVPRMTKTQQLKNKIKAELKQNQMRGKQNQLAVRTVRVVSTINQKTQTNPQGLHKTIKTPMVNKSKQVLSPKAEERVKSIQKSVLRVGVARKSRQLVNALSDRGYPNVQNWDCFRKSLKKDLEKSSQQLTKGYKPSHNQPPPKTPRLLFSSKQSAS